jgi:hypothetical protein
MDKGGNKTITFSKSVTKERKKEYTAAISIKDQATLIFCLWKCNAESNVQLWTDALLLHVCTLLVIVP